MRPSLSRLGIAALALLLPIAASAHEHRTYQIGDKQYNITVGSMNEPIHVGDKSGVEVMVSDLSTPHAATAIHDDGDDDDGPTGTPVTGLEQNLKVEISAGDQKKVFDLEPEWGTAGAYQAVYYPTVQTTFAYRLFGTINNTAIDLSFTCNPAATEDTPEDTTSTNIADGVTQLTKGGAFSCPEAKEDVEFPVRSAVMATQSSGSMDSVALGLSVIAFVFSINAMRRKR